MSNLERDVTSRDTFYFFSRGMHFPYFNLEVMNNSKLCNSSTIDYSSPSVTMGYLEFGGLNRTEL